MSYVLTNPTGQTWDHSYSILSGSIRPNEPTPEYMGRFDEIICDFMREQGVPGAALCINLHGRPIYRQGKMKVIYGISSFIDGGRPPNENKYNNNPSANNSLYNVFGLRGTPTYDLGGYGISRAGEPVSSSSHFRIASISKIITAIGVMSLVEKNIICLDNVLIGPAGVLHTKPWQKITSRKNIYKITVRHLLEHSAGWDRDKDWDHVFWYQKEDHAEDIDVWNNMTLVRYVLQHKLRFSPGSQHAYSNFGYLLLGIAIEAVTNMPYSDYIHSVLRSIGIEDIYIGKTKQDTVDYNEVKYYNNKDPAVEKSVFHQDGFVAPQYGAFPMENTGAFGGWVTCAQNLVKILDSLVMEYDHLDHLLTRGIVKQMLKRPKFADGEAWYGLGLDIEDSGKSFGHTGAMEGTSTTVHHNKNGLTWSLLLNSWAKDMDLDGLIKYALSTICGLPLWQSTQMIKCEFSEYQVMSSDMRECVRILLPRAQVYTHVLEMRADGYIITHINVLSLTDDVLFNIVWKKSQVLKEWCICVDVKLEDFNDFLEKMRAKGLCTAFLESYKVKGEVCHVFVLEKMFGVSQKVYCIEDINLHRIIFMQYTHTGYMLKTQSVLDLGQNKVLISAIYDKVKCLEHQQETYVHQEIWLDVSIENFVTLLGEFTDKLLKLDYLQFYSTEDIPKLSAVWSNSSYVRQDVKRCKNTGVKVVKSKKDIVFQRHDVTKYGFLFELRESMNSNRPVSFVCAYEFEGVVYYVTIWERNLRSHKPSELSSLAMDSDEQVENNDAVVVKMEMLE